MALCWYIYETFGVLALGNMLISVLKSDDAYTKVSEKLQSSTKMQT